MFYVTVEVTVDTNLRGGTNQMSTISLEMTSSVGGRQSGRDASEQTIMQTGSATGRQIFPAPSEADFRHMFAFCDDGIFLTSRDVIVHANRAALRLLGADDQGDLQGLAMPDVLPYGESEDLTLHITRVVGNTYAMRRKLRRLDGSLIDVEVAMAPYHDDGDRGSDAGGNSRCMVIVRDLALRRRGANQPAMHEQQFQLITEAAPASIAYIDERSHYRFVNAVFANWLDKPIEEITGRTAAEVHGSAFGQMQAQIARALRGFRSSHEYQLQSRDGMRRVLAIHVPDRRDDGRVRGVFCFAIDITHEKREPDALHRKKQKLGILRQAAPTFVAECDQNYRIRAVDRNFSDQFGIARNDAIGELVPEIIGEAIFSQVRSFVDAALAGNAREHEIKLPFRNGSFHYLHIMYVPEFDTNGRVHGVSVAASDVTRLRPSGEPQHRREHDFKTLIENSPDGIARIDRNMRHIYVNPAIETVTGLQAEEYLGKTKAELGLPYDLVNAWESACRAAFESGTEQRFSFELKKNAGIHYYSARIIPETDHAGRIESVLGISYDVTERTRMEKEHQQLLARERQARIQAEMAAKARDEFLAIVSHELRAPLNGVQSWAHILENYVKDATSSALAQRALHGIRIGVAQQVRLIEDLLDVTRMMSGKLRLVKHPFMLLPAIQAAVESVRELAAAKHIGITCAYQISSEQVDGDSDRIQQAVWNLLSNAIKFTPQDGNVWLTAACADSQIMITVRDDGVGIAPEFLPHLFDRFSQQDTSSTRGHSGLGLGLFLVRHLIELHGGSVKVESSGEGQGTTFSIVLPLHTKRQRYPVITQDAASIENDASLPSLEGLQVLLVDDQEEARESLAILLATAGAAVFPAASSKEAFEWLSGIGPNELPDILICDIAMPVEDGYSVLRKIRTWESEQGNTPLRRLPALALTAFTQREDRIRALTAGFQMHMTKPVAPEELIVVIAMMTARG